MSNLEELKKELQRLLKRRDVLAKEVERARARAKGRRTDPSNKNFAARLAEELKELDKRIDETKAKIPTEGDDEKS